MAANRDEEVFADADRFDVARKQAAQQISFGFGEHFCPGAGLARMEAKALLNAVLDRFGSIELAQQPTPVLSLFRNSWDDMNVVFGAR
jgi:cytochrome P450